ncbi:MAG: hypothetical protein HY976_00195, partial [Candidatus Kerfeldbacteria bacterium]|nr:hypothetical protein [Candidatus Kerfeldbacteria bacterium]
MVEHRLVHRNDRIHLLLRPSVRHHHPPIQIDTTARLAGPDRTIEPRRRRSGGLALYARHAQLIDREVDLLHDLRHLDPRHLDRPVHGLRVTTERLQKFIAGSGITSRRKAEELISAGRVFVNGKKIKELGTKIDPQHDKVSVDGHLIPNVTAFRYIALNKP